MCGGTAQLCPALPRPCGGGFCHMGSGVTWRTNRQPDQVPCPLGRRRIFSAGLLAPHFQGPLAVSQPSHWVKRVFSLLGDSGRPAVWPLDFSKCHSPHRVPVNLLHQSQLLKALQSLTHQFIFILHCCDESKMFLLLTGNECFSNISEHKNVGLICK
jgi:hypothetical protein